MDEKHITAALEAMLFAHGDAVSAQRLADVLEITKEAAELHLEQLKLEYERESRGA